MACVAGPLAGQGLCGAAAQVPLRSSDALSTRHGPAHSLVVLTVSPDTCTRTPVVIVCGQSKPQRQRLCRGGGGGGGGGASRDRPVPRPPSTATAPPPPPPPPPPRNGPKRRAPRFWGVRGPQPRGLLPARPHACYSRSCSQPAQRTQNCNARMLCSHAQHCNSSEAQPAHLTRQTKHGSMYESRLKAIKGSLLANTRKQRHSIERNEDQQPCGRISSPPASLTDHRTGPRRPHATGAPPSPLPLSTAAGCGCPSDCTAPRLCPRKRAA
jgi:hypothetical protein